MNQTELQKLLPSVVHIVLQAGEIIKEHWTRKIKIEHKGPVDLVTETDLAVEAFLARELYKLRPDAAFMGEESSAQQAGFQTQPNPQAQPNVQSRPDQLPEQTPQKITKQQDIPADALFWVVDPLDGTTNYAHRLPFVATSVGLCKGNQVLLGVVNCPILHECFWAGQGLGAFLGSDLALANFSSKPEIAPQDPGRYFNSTQRLATSNANTLAASLLATGFPYSQQGRLPTILKRLESVLPRTQGLRRCGAAAIDLAYVAAGRFDAYFESWLAPWDSAAGWLLVEEAGGKVSSIENRPYNIFAESILASNGLVHEKLSQLLTGCKKN